MKRVAAAIWLLSLVAPCLPAMGGTLDNHYLFPILSSTPGEADTAWLTEVTITNPQFFDLVLTLWTSSDGEVTTSSLTVPGGATLLWEDFVGEVLQTGGTVALEIIAESQNNRFREPRCLVFAMSVRIFNDGHPSGTFGQEVPPLVPSTGFLGAGAAFLTGVRNLGTPGEDGFRTNLGFWHRGSAQARLTLQVFNSSGQRVHSELVNVNPHDPKIVALPRDLVISSGVVVVSTLDGASDCAVYASVVDNRTGDGVLRAMQLANPDDLAGCASVIP